MDSEFSVMTRPTDIHRHTMLTDPNFDAVMCATYGTEWRWEMPVAEARRRAKTWNFLRFYGAPLEELLKWKP